MRIDNSQALARDLDIVAEAGGVSGLTDAELVGRFVDRRKGSAEVAFEALVRRHGHAVLGTCRRVLRDPTEAEDAFQATFLVLARKAGSVRVEASLAPWLRGVARRVAGKALARARKRRGSERSIARQEASDPEGPEVDLRPILFEELDRLPEKYRTPVVLCHLEGLSLEEAARQLSWPVGTVSGRLSRARDLLRTRLIRRGLAPAAILTVLATREAVAAISPTIIEATARLAIQFVRGGAIPESIQTLTRGALTAMFANQIKMGTLAASIVVLSTAGAGYGLGQFGEAQQPVKKPDQRLAANPPATPQVPDALPSVPPPPAPPTSTLASPSVLQDRVPPVRPVPIPITPEQRALNAKNEALMARFPKYRERAKQPMGSYGFTGDQSSIVGRPSVLSNNALVVAWKPDGRSLKALSLKGSRRWMEYQYPDGIDVLPVTLPGSMIALAYSGKDIRELAVFNADHRDVGPNGALVDEMGGWLKQTLREPVSDELIPITSPAGLYYLIGKDIYAYSEEADSWGVLHFNGPETPKCTFNSARSLLAWQGSQVHVFSFTMGQWSEPVEIKPDEPAK